MSQVFSFGLLTNLSYRYRLEPCSTGCSPEPLPLFLPWPRPPYPIPALFGRLYRCLYPPCMCSRCAKGCRVHVCPLSRIVAPAPSTTATPRPHMPSTSNPAPTCSQNVWGYNWDIFSHGPFTSRPQILVCASLVGISRIPPPAFVSSPPAAFQSPRVLKTCGGCCSTSLSCPHPLRA